MTLNTWKVIAYSTLVKAGKYILSEDDREYDSQILVPADYQIAVAERIVTE